MDRLKFIGNKRGLLEHKSASQSYLITPNCTMKNRRLMEVIHIGNHFKYQFDQCIGVWSVRTKLKSNTEIHVKPCILSDGHFNILIKYWLLRYTCTCISKYFKIYVPVTWTSQCMPIYIQNIVEDTFTLTKISTAYDYDNSRNVSFL